MVDAYLGRMRTKAIIDTGGLRTLGNEALRHALERKDGADASSLPTQVVDPQR